jgi:heme-degrading monooxygenase HmoA
LAGTRRPIIYIRVTRTRSAAGQPDPTISALKDLVVAAASGAVGFSGAALYADRAAGRIAAVTFWENAQALAASELTELTARANAAESRGMRVIDVTRFQIAALDQAQRPQTTAYVRIDNGSTPTGRLDAFASFVDNEIVPGLRKRHGYRSLAVGIDRTSGLVAVTSTWETAGDRAAGDSGFAAVLQRAGEFEMRPILIELYEQVA